MEGFDDLWGFSDFVTVWVLVLLLPCYGCLVWVFFFRFFDFIPVNCGWRQGLIMLIGWWRTVQFWPVAMVCSLTGFYFPKISSWSASMVLGNLTLNFKSKFHGHFDGIDSLGGLVAFKLASNDVKHSLFDSESKDLTKKSQWWCAKSGFARKFRCNKIQGQRSFHQKKTTSLENTWKNTSSPNAGETWWWMPW